MSDEQLIKKRLEFIMEHLSVITERMAFVSDAEWLVNSKEGMLIFDSLVARLQPVGENIKKIEKNPNPALQKQTCKWNLVILSGFVTWFLTTMKCWTTR